MAHRLAVGAGYDGVHFEVLRHPSGAPAGQSAFAQANDELVEAWNREQRRFEDHPLREIIERTRRPIILDDVQNDQRLTDAERELLRAAGLRSALLVPMLWQNDLLGHLAVASKREAAFGPRDVEFLMAVATQVTAIVRMATLVEELQSASDRLVQAQTETVVLLAASAEAHDHATGLHLENVRAITEALARELGYGEEEAKELGLAAVLHDIGKVRVPDSLLSSAGTLADEEWELMKHHTSWGAEFLAGRPGFELAATIARSHHERWDGGGYPDGLAGEAIPESAAIVAVADSFDAMTSDRPYRAAPVRRRGHAGDRGVFRQAVQPQSRAGPGAAPQAKDAASPAPARTRGEGGGVAAGGQTSRTPCTEPPPRRRSPRLGPPVSHPSCTRASLRLAIQGHMALIVVSGQGAT